ncbi:MAG: heavy metal translocating P-type ATPase, partial [Caulobacterales bacterium 32-67-6]
MADQTKRDRASLADQAEVRTTAPAALNENTHRHDSHDHDHDDEDGHDHEHPFERQEALRIGFVAVAAALVWFKVWEPIPTISVIGVVGLLVGGWPILKEAFENVLQRRMTMELSMTIAIVAAAAIGEFFTALVITLFVLVAEVLEGLTVGRGRKAIRDLLEFLPSEVSVRRTGSIRTISAAELNIGDAILVAPGGRIPVDGAVLSGNSFVDESRI